VTLQIAEGLAQSCRREPARIEWLAKLPDKQRHAVVLRFVGDLPYAEIGDLAGTSEAAARQNVRAGVARLREELT